jgi:hypothetical protein
MDDGSSICMEMERHHMDDSSWCILDKPFTSAKFLPTKMSRLKCDHLLKSTSIHMLKTVAVSPRAISISRASISRIARLEPRILSIVSGSEFGTAEILPHSERLA